MTPLVHYRLLGEVRRLFWNALKTIMTYGCPFLVPEPFSTFNAFPVPTLRGSEAALRADKFSLLIVKEDKTQYAAITLRTWASASFTGVVYKILQTGFSSAEMTGN